VSGLDVVARGLAVRALSQSATTDAASVILASGNSVQQVLEAADTSDQLALSTAVYPVGAHLGTADGHRYEVVEVDGDFVTAGEVHLRILPDHAGEFHFEAAAPNVDILLARAWAMQLPDGSVLNVNRNYVLDSAAEFANRICARGKGKFTLRPGGPSAVVQLVADGCEWYVALDGNKDAVTSGAPSCLVILGAAHVTVGARIANAKGHGILAIGATNLRLTSKLHVSGAEQHGVLVFDGSDDLSIEDGARIVDNGRDNLFVSDAGSAPCRNGTIGAIGAARAGKVGSGYWCGIRLREVEGFSISGVQAHDCSGAGIAIQAAVTTPALRFSRHGTLTGCVCEGNNDGVIIDDYCQFVTSSGGQYNLNRADGLDINATEGCKSLGDTCNANGEKGLLLWGSRNALVHGATVCNNNTSRLTANDSGINIQTNATTGTVPMDCRVSHSLCVDSQAVKTQTYGIRIAHGSGHLIEDNQVDGNASAAINDASGNAAQNPKRRNRGYKTEANFSAMVPAGATSVVVSGAITGIAGTGVTLQQAGAIPLGDIGVDNRMWLSAFTTTGFTINLAAAPAGNLTFNCWARVYGDGVGR